MDINENSEQYRIQLEAMNALSKELENTINKKILVQITNLDTAYDYIQVGVLRYSAFVENGAATTDTYLIDKYYKLIIKNV
jgi:Tfp pilus assembly pilus retraction ATPase PilT